MSVWDQLEQQAATSSRGGDTTGSIWDQLETGRFAPPAPPPTRNPAAMLNDYVIEAANAVLGFGKAITDFAKPGTELSAMIEDLIQKGQESQSLVAQQAKQELGEAIEAGGWEALKGVGRYGLTSPGLAISQAAGSFAIPAGAIRGGMGLARAAGAGAQGVSRAGMVSGATVGAAGAGGDAAGEAFDMTYQGLLEQGVSEEEARAIATRAAREASVVPAAIGGAAGVFGAEALLFGRAATAGTRSILRTAGSEALQEAVEEGATAASANIAAGQYVEGIDPTRGVVGSAAMGGLLGGITGGGVAALTGQPLYNRRQPGSLLKGSNDELDGGESPAGQAIGGAINKTAYTPPAEQFVGPTQPILLPGQTAAQGQASLVLPSTDPRIAYSEAVRKQARGEILSQYERYLLNNPPPDVSIPAETTSARAPMQTQMELFGTPLTARGQTTVPTPQPPAAPQMGAQPGQQELFFPSGAPTYGAAGPSLTDLALQRLQLEGAAPTKTRVPLAERAEDLFSNGFIDENEHDTVYAMLRDSKYGQVERFLKGVEDARRKQEAQQAAAGVGGFSEQTGTDRDFTGAGRTGAGSVQPVGAGSVVGGQDGQQDVAAGVSGARTGTSEPTAGSVSGDGGPLAGEGEVQGQEVAKSEWNEQFRTNTNLEPPFDALNAARKAQWADAVANNQATGELFDRLVSEHNQEKESAVQKRETKEVSVRKRARGGQEVDQRDTERQKAAREGGRKAQTQEVTRWTGTTNKDGNETGEGTYTWPDGDKFVGTMRNGKIWEGEFITADGKRQKVVKGSLEQAAGELDTDLSQKIDEVTPNQARRTFIKFMGALGVGSILPTTETYASDLSSLLRRGQLTAALEQISKSSANPAFRQLAKKLLALDLSKTKLMVVEPGVTYKQGIPNSLSYSAGIARINRKNKEVTIYLRGDLGLGEDMVLHEAIHAALMARYDMLNYYMANPQLRGKKADPAIDLYREVFYEFRAAVRKEFPGDKLRDAPLSITEAYGNPDEFITYALTNESLQDWMRSKRYQGKTLWGKFVEFVKGVLGFGGTAPTWLDAALRVSNNLLDAAAKDFPDFSVSQKLLDAAAKDFPDFSVSQKLLGKGDADLRAALPTEETAPSWVPKNIWDLHEKAMQAEAIAAGREPSDIRPQDRARNETMTFRRLNNAVREYVGGDEQAARDLMTRMREESNRRESAVERRGPEGAAVGGNTKAQVDKWFAPILKAWPFGPKVNVVQSVADLDPAMKPSPTAKGAFYKGELWVVADNATSRLDAMTTLFHEAVGHFGFRSLVRAYSTEYINLMDGIARENTRVREEAKKWRDRNADRQSKMKLTSAQFRALSIEEAIADMAYQSLRNPGLNILGRSPALTRFVKWIAGRLKAIGFTDLAKAINQFTADVDVYRLLSMSRNVLTTGANNAVSNPEDNPLFSSFNQSARWSNKRVNNLLSSWAYTNDENDTKAYAGFVNPQEFLDATTTADYRTTLDKENKPLDVQALAGETQPIFILMKPDFKYGVASIIGHEGRHRMMALRDAGVQRVPVVFVNGYSGQRMENAEPVDFLTFGPESFGDQKAISGFSISNLIPISYAYKEQIVDTFGTGATQADIVFRDAGDVATAPQERNEIARTVGQFVARLNPNNYSKGRRALLGLRFLTDIRDNLAGQLPGLREYVKRSLDMGATTNELLKESSQIANRWANLGEEGQVLSQIAAGATASDIHPDIPLDQAEHKSGPNRSVTNRHLFTADGKLIDAEVANNHKKLSDMFNKLSAQAKRVYYEARDYMHKNWQKRQELLNKNVNSVFDPLIADARRVGNMAKVKELTRERNQFIREFGRLLSEVKGPYFPLSRFGEYYVVFKSDQYKAIENDLNKANQELTDLYNKYEIPVTLRKETEAASRAFVKVGEDPIIKLSETAKKEISDARKKARELQSKLDKMVKEGEKHFVSESFESEAAANTRADELGVDVRLAEEYFRELNPINRGFVDKLASAIGGALPSDQAIKAREAMYQIYLASLPQTSALKNEMKRRGVKGWNTDMQRAFAAHSQKDAHYLSRLEHMDEMTSDLLQMRRNKKTMKQDDIYNEIARRHAASMNYHLSPLEDGMSTLAFIYQLGISPAFLLTNMSQPWMISLPFMTGKYNTSAVIRELGKGFADAGKAATTAAKEQGFNFEIDLKKFPDGERQMLEEAMKAGLLDISLAVDIGAYAQGSRTGVNKVTHALGILPHQVEVINRTMTALAAYRLETAAGRSQEQATEYAKQVLDKTHINYSSTNAPFWLKPGVVPFGKVLFQYRKFQLGMLTLMANQIKQAYKGNKAERQQARRTLFGIFGMHAIMTGAVGLPAVGTIMFIANVLNAIFGDEDEPFEAEAEFRRFLADSFGVETGLVLAKGLPTLLGVDFSRNIGLGDITAPIRVLRDDKEGRDLYLEVLAAGLGPTIGGLGPQFAEGIQMLLKGDIYRGVEGLTPRFFRDWTRAVRLSEEGLTTKAGQVIFQPEEISAWDKAIQAVGFPSTKISERGAAAGAVQQARKTLQDRRSELTRDYVAARRANDQRALAAVQREIQEFNRKRIAKGESTLKPRDLLNAYRQRERYTKQLNPQGVSLARSERALGEYGAFAVVR